MSPGPGQQPTLDPATARLFDVASRGRKAAKILAALSHVLEQGLDELICVDIGCSRGLITQHLAGHFRMTLGIEYDPEAVAYAARFIAPRLGFARGDAQRLPIADGSADVVICAQVYEHVGDAQALFREIRRVLKPKGVCFLSGPNRLYPWEFHVHLPFVHWLPARWARACVRWLRHGEEFDVRALTLWGLRRQLVGFAIEDLTVTMIRFPERFGFAGETSALRWFSRLPEGLLRLMLPLVPNFNWVLSKAQGETQGAVLALGDPSSARRPVGR